MHFNPFAQLFFDVPRQRQENLALMLEIRYRNEFSSNEGEISLACNCVFRSLFKAPTGNLLKRILFEVCPFLVAFPYFADSFSKPSWHVSMKYIKMRMISFSEIRWNKVHQ